MNTQTEVILNRICRQTVEKKASEIYFLPGQSPFIRINGEVKALTGEGVVAASFINELLDIFLSPEEKEKMEKQREIIIVRNIGKIGNCQIDFYFQRRSATCRIKLLTQEITDLSELGLPVMVKDFTNLLKGIVFVTGPRDSGRSTLLISLLDYINKNQNKFITTIEEPI